MNVKLKDVASFAKGSQINGEDLLNDAKYVYLNGGVKPSGKWNDYNVESEAITISEGGNSCGYVNFMKEPFWCGAHCYFLYNVRGNKKYLYYALKSQQNRLMKLRSGACMPNIKKSDLGNFTFAYEDNIEKQEDIVRRLDHLEICIDLLQEELGRLDLLVKSRFVEMFGDPVENEKAWNTIPLEDACISIVDCPHSTPHYTYENTGYMCIRTSIVKKNRILWDEIEYIPKAEYFQRIKRRKPQKGDIIYTREGAILGIAAVIDRECNVALGQRSMLLSPDTSVCLPKFLSTAMNFDSFLNKVLGGVSGSASPHINVGDIRIYNIMMPPIELQNIFAAFVREIDKSKLAVKESLEKLEILKKALMQQYFG